MSPFFFIFTTLQAQDTINPVQEDTIQNDTIEEPADTLDYPMSPSAIENEINYSASDSITFNLQDEEAFLYGDARITYQDMEVNAPYVPIKWEENLIDAQSFHPADTKPDTLARNVSLREGEREFEASRATYNIQTEEGIIHDLYTEEQDGFIHGDKVKKDSMDNFYINEAKYTTCDRRDDPHFHLAARRLKFTNENEIVSGPANLVVAQIPLPLVMPFGFFPDQTDRTSGVIPPSYGESSSRGFHLKDGGYYLAISDYFDLAITGDIYSKGGWSLGASSHYELRNRFDGQIAFDYGNQVENPESPTEEISENFRFNWQHSQDPNAHPYADFSANVNLETTGYGIEQSGTYEDQGKSVTTSSINYDRNIPNTPFSFSTNISHRMDLSDSTVSMGDAPSFNLNMSRIQPFAGDGPQKAWYEEIGIDYNLSLDNSIIDVHEDVFYSRDVLSEFEQSGNHSMNIRPNLDVFENFNVNPRFRYDGDLLFDRTRKVPGPEDTTLVDETERGFYATHDFNTGVDVTTTIYGFFNINSLGISQMRHVFTPSLGFSYKPALTHDFLRYQETVDHPDPEEEPVTFSPFGGSPRSSVDALSRSATIDIDFSNRIDAKKMTGEEEEETIDIIDNFDIGTSYDFVENHLNDITLGLRTNLFGRFDTRLRGTLDPYVDEELEQFEIVENYRIGRLKSANASIGTSLRSGIFGEGTENDGARVRHHRFYHHNHYLDRDLDWDVSLDYTMRYNEGGDDPIRQNMNTSGNINLTEKWDVNGSMEINMDAFEINRANIGITRDLHCWGMTFEWIPIGTRQSFSISIRPDADLLQDLEIDRDMQDRDF